jgi:hypothetical protein
MENTMDPYYLRPVFEDTFLNSPELEEFKCLFQNEWKEKAYPYRLRYYLNQYEFAKSIVVNAMVLKHYQSIEQLNYYPRAVDIAEINADRFMAEEIEDGLDNVRIKRENYHRKKAEEKNN